MCATHVNNHYIPPDHMQLKTLWISGEEILFVTFRYINYNSNNSNKYKMSHVLVHRIGLVMQYVLS